MSGLGVSHEVSDATDDAESVRQRVGLSSGLERDVRRDLSFVWRRAISSLLFFVFDLVS